MTQAVLCENVWKSYHGRQPLGIKTLMVGRKAPRETRFTRRWALNDVSFSAARGQALGVVGANGSGKTTLLSALLGTVPVDRGRIGVSGRVASLLELGAGFHNDLTGRENAILLGSILGMRLADIRSRFDAILEFSELEDAIDSPLRTYSAGMTVRLGFSVIVHSPAEVLLIDEVLAVGDARFQEKCRDFLKDFKKRNGTLIIVSHNLREIESICDQGLCLELGHVADAGSIEGVVTAYRARTGRASAPGNDPR